MKIPILLFFAFALLPISAQVNIELAIHQAEQFDINLGNDTSLCANETLLLDASDNSLTYLWNTDETTQSISINSSGTYFVYALDNNYCSDSDTISVIFNQLPEIILCDDTTLCNGEILTIDAGTGFISYEWNNGTTEQTMDVDSAGQYYVIVENESGCYNTDTVHVSYTVCTGINDLFITRIKIIPNPNDGKFKIDFGQSMQYSLTLSVYNNFGSLVFKDDFSNHPIELNLEDLPKGVYYINFLSKDIMITKKIIIE